MSRFSYNESTGQFFSKPYTKKQLAELGGNENEENNFLGTIPSLDDAPSEVKGLINRLQGNKLSDKEKQKELRNFLSKIARSTHPFKK